MGSATSNRTVFTATVRLRTDRVHSHILKSCHGVTVVCLFLIILQGDITASFSVQLSIKCTPDKLIEHPKRRLVCGRKELENILFTKKLLGIFVCVNVMVFLLLLLAGDVRPNPKPN